MAFSFFMRDRHTLEHAVRHTLNNAGGRIRLKVWDAGCAHGQETYTLAMLFAENMGYFGFKSLNIDATDYDRDNRFGDIVEAAEYPYADLKRIPNDLFERYFEEGGQCGRFRLNEKIRRAIRFRYHDLLTDSEPAADYSLIVCKNVLLHFPPQERIRVFRMFHRSLGPGGFLCTEQTQKLPVEVEHLFERVVPDAELYRKVTL
jgi:chemotaxis protein methyltransferase CheR